MKIKNIREQLGDNLLSVVKTSVPEQEILVVKKLDFVVTDLIREMYGEEEKPMLFSEKEIQHGADVFAVDFYSIKCDYKVVWGKDVFKDIKIKNEHVRHQLEFEFRSKLITLRQRYLSITEPEKLIETIVPTMVPLCRALLLLKKEKSPGNVKNLLEKVYKRYDLSNDVLIRLAKKKSAPLEDILTDLMQVLEELSHHVDGM